MYDITYSSNVFVCILFITDISGKLMIYISVSYLIRLYNLEYFHIWIEIEQFNSILYHLHVPLLIV